MVLGHDLGAGHRTQDVRISDDVSFDTMLLRKPTLKGLKKTGFIKPSPIQLHAIPLGKCGFDLLIEAKSGTGKTGVFTVIALEKLDLEMGVQAIILAPTREIASQVSEVIAEIGSQYKGLNVAVVMGGLPVKEDIDKFNKNVHIVVGSPGRLRHLIQDNHIDISAVRLLVLDEADKLMEKSFQPDINYIFSLLPKQKQIIMSSATYSEETKTFVSKYVQKAQHVCPESNNVLLGIAQKVVIVPPNSNIIKQTKHRYQELKKILNSKQFKQCLIFCNYQVRVGELHRMLSRDKWPAEQLYGQQEQTERLDALKTLQEYKCRILVSTDLAARGIDASNVDIVINFEPPFEWQTYLHRIGRAGRYGSYGMAISILSEGKEKTKFKETLARTNIQFNLCDLWSNEPFNLTETETNLKKDEALVTLLPNHVLLQNEKKSEELLWKALTTEPLGQPDIKPEICSFKELCDSFKMLNESHVEPVTDLVGPFNVKQNKITNIRDSFEFKHVKVTNLITDGIKYWDNLDTNDVKEFPNVPKITMNITDGNSVTEKESNENESHLTEKIKKGKHFAKCFERASPKILHYKDTTPDHDISDAQVILQKDLKIKANEIEMDPSKQSLINMCLPNAFGKKKENKRHVTVPKYHYLNNNNENTTSEMMHQADADVNLLTVSRKKKQGKCLSSYNKINTGETDINYDDIDYDEQGLVNAGATYLGKPKSDSNRRKQRYQNSNHHYEKNTNNTGIEPMNQALINEGLPTAFGKVKQNENYFDYQSDFDKESIKLTKSKPKHKQQKPMKIQDHEKQTKNTNSSNTYTREYPQEYLFPTFVENNSQDSSSSSFVENDSSDSSCESSYNKKNAFKLRNDKARTYKKTSCHNQNKKQGNSMEQIREKMFNDWYNQLKYQTRYIQNTLYIEELRKM